MSDTIPSARREPRWTPAATSAACAAATLIVVLGTALADFGRERGGAITAVEALKQQIQELVKHDAAQQDAITRAAEEISILSRRSDRLEMRDDEARRADALFLQRLAAIESKLEALGELVKRNRAALP
jgi:chromosome segregation ATPase